MENSEHEQTFRFIIQGAHELTDWLKRRNELEKLFLRGVISEQLREEYETLCRDIEIRIAFFSGLMTQNQ